MKKPCRNFCCLNIRVLERIVDSFPQEKGKGKGQGAKGRDTGWYCL